MGEVTGNVGPIKATPATFARVVSRLRELGLIRLREGAARWNGYPGQTPWSGYARRLELIEDEGAPVVECAIDYLSQGSRTKRGILISPDPDATSFAVIHENFHEVQISLRSYSLTVGLRVDLMGGVRLDVSAPDDLPMGEDEILDELEKVILVDAVAATTEPSDPLAAYRPIAGVAPPRVVAVPDPSQARVFLGHGGNDDQWRTLKDELAFHNITANAFESELRAGEHIGAVLQRILDETNVAVLVMTAADETTTGAKLARQNVVHEIGLFQGRHGWSSAIVLLENGVTEPSNLAGTQQIRFEKGAIAGTAGRLSAEIKKRFPST